MHYYEVLVGDSSYHGEAALTYSAETSLPIGAVARVSIRNKRVLAIISRKVSKPSFAVKPIDVLLQDSLPSQSFALLQWLREYYPAPLGVIVRQFLPPTTASAKKAAVITDSSKTTIQLPPLSADQEKALKKISGPGSFLLHGITGSGKSRVYIELAKRTLGAGHSVIMLTPEIGLTAQLTDVFQAQFKDQVFVLHSQLSTAKRRDIWNRIFQTTSPVIVVGPRSALFSPIHNLGLVIQDESHDSAYKSDSAPHYNTARVAAKLAMLHKAQYVSGSATPAIEDYYLAQQRERPIITMNNLAKQSPGMVVTTEVIDLKNHDLFSRSSILSTALIDAITKSLQRKEQALIFLNRRGTANVVLCSNCGWQTLCPNCDLPLAYHGDEHQMRCHVCGFHNALPTICPVCGNAEILLKSVGTKAVLTEIERLFPNARVQRFDTDLKKDERLEQHIDALVKGSADIIVGTQIVAKGLDLPRLSVVGVINADSSLLLPDYTAAERTYQLLSQVVGRVGRGHTNGTIIVQSYDPDSLTLRTALDRNWTQFYEIELLERKTFLFPPFVHLLQLNCLRATSKSAEKTAQALVTGLTSLPGIRIEGPTPAFHPKESGKYNWQVVVKSKQRSLLLTIIKNLPAGWRYDIDPSNLL